MFFDKLIGPGLNIAGGVIASRAAKKAANAQVAATEKAGGITTDYSGRALDALKGGYQDQQGYLRPFLQGGQGAFNQLVQLNQPGGELAQGFQFNPQTMMNDPGYQLRLQEGQKALERLASARGVSGSGGTLKALQRYNQDYASNEFGNAYNRAFNTFETNQNNRFNRLAALAGYGQNAGSQLAGEAGQYGAGVAGVNQNTGNALADLATQAGNARASGYIGSANAWNGALGGAANNLLQQQYLRQMPQQQPRQWLSQ